MSTLRPLQRVSVLGFALLLVGCAQMGSSNAPSDSPRQRLSINSDWRFSKEPDPAPSSQTLAYAKIKDWMMANGQEFVKDPAAPAHPRPQGNLGEEVPQTQAGFDDSQWRKLDLPHDFGVEGPFIPTGNGNTGKLPYYGIVWYRKHLDIPASDAGKQIYLDIDGAMSYANVWLNGQYAGGWGYGYSSFRVDLTPYVKPGGSNVLSIRLDNPNQSSRWYPGGGIYRNVWLTKTAPIHVGQWGTYLTTPEVSPTSAEIDLKTTVDNNSNVDTNVTVRTAIYALDSKGQRQGGAVATSETATVNVAAKKSETSPVKIKIANPKLWDIQSPNRYVAVTSVAQDGKTVDVYETPFGIRTIKFDPNQGFLLNGKLVEFHGVCAHADIGALGSIANVRGLERQLQILREMGVNAIRTSHNPPAPELLELCDKMGFVVDDEAFDCWGRGKTTNDYHLLFADWSEKDMRAMIKRDRNHPCVIIWSIGNEVGEGSDPTNGHPVGRRLTAIAHDEDPTRPTTLSAPNREYGYNGFASTVDIFGYNYLRPPDLVEMYANWRKAYPDQFLFTSESASCISSRGVYVFPVSENKAQGFTPDRQMSSYDLYAPPWAQPPDLEFEAQDRAPSNGGEFIWTGFDYLGEPTANGVGFGGGGRRGRGAASAPATAEVARGPTTAPAPDTRRSSYFGVIDLAGFPKDRYYIYQARWRPDLPMAHILPHWNWAERVGQVTPVHVYSSGDEAELFLNGKSQGRKKLEKFQYRFRWDEVKYEPNELKVVTWKNGKEWATETMKTTGAASKVTLKPDRATIANDGNDLSFVTVAIADQSGAMVPRSMNRLKFTISGPGEIVATDNGDPTSMESFQSHDRNAFNGLCLVIVRAKPGASGKITLTAASDGLAKSETTITAAR